MAVATITFDDQKNRPVRCAGRFFVGGPGACVVGVVDAARWRD
jgi:hypothetical protein